MYEVWRPTRGWFQRERSELLVSATAGEEYAFRRLIAEHHEDLRRVCATGVTSLHHREAMSRLDPDDRALLAMRYVAGFDCRFAGSSSRGRSGARYSRGSSTGREPTTGWRPCCRRKATCCTTWFPTAREQSSATRGVAFLGVAGQRMAGLSSARLHHRVSPRHPRRVSRPE